jgi:DNA-binding MarR family transcriptional regulator
MTTRPFLAHYLPFLLVRADTLLSEPLMAELERTGHSVPEWRILATLADSGELSIGEIAELTILTQPTVSRWIDRLEGRGHVVRRVSPTDGRRTTVHITGAGQRAAAQLVEIAKRRFDDVTAGIPQRELRQIESLLLGIIDRLAGTSVTKEAS